MRGNAFRYLGQMVFDRTGPRLLVSWFIAAMLLVPMHFGFRGRQAPPHDALLRILEQLHFQLAVIALVILFHGIVSEDRTRGYYRFYLAKPVSPLWFYGQSFVLAVLGMLAFTTGYLALFALAIEPAWDWKLLTSALSLGVLIGGMMFLFSTVSNRDWILTIAVTLTCTIVRMRFPKGESTAGKVLDAVLPPNHLTDERILTAGQIAWVLGWGVALFLLGLWVLKSRPLGED